MLCLKEQPLAPLPVKGEETSLLFSILISSLSEYPSSPYAYISKTLSSLLKRKRKRKKTGLCLPVKNVSQGICPEQTVAGSVPGQAVGTGTGTLLKKNISESHSEKALLFSISIKTSNHPQKGGRQEVTFTACLLSLSVSSRKILLSLKTKIKKRHGMAWWPSKFCMTWWQQRRHRHMAAGRLGAPACPLEEKSSPVSSKNKQAVGQYMVGEAGAGLGERH